ncbi:hypothetical protein ES703_70949 [subsurface metagenome]
MWRCINYIFGYCSGEPEPVEKTRTETFGDLGGIFHTEEISRLSCKHDPMTCGKFRTFAEVFARFKTEHPNQVPAADSEK